MTYKNLDLGPHTFAVRQVDGAGQASAAAVRKWRIDVNFVAGDDGSNVKAVTGLVNAKVTTAQDKVGVGCELNRGSIQLCSVAAYADVAGLRHTRKGSRVAESDMQLIGKGTVTLAARGQTSAVTDVQLNALGRQLIKAHPMGVPVGLLVVARPFDTDTYLQSTVSSVLRAPEMLIVPGNGMFAGGSYALGGDGLQYVKAVAKMLDSAVKVRCEGYSDSSASAKRANAIGFLRARAVCSALEKAGLKADVGSVSRGSTNPLGDNSTPAGRRRNRRVEIRVWF
jgi:outer membrane protein OmpA-like peptidoglycan-associated protein